MVHECGTRNLSLLRFVVLEVCIIVSTCDLTGLIRVRLNFPLNGTRANVYAHVAVVREHVWRTVCSVCATGARSGRFSPWKVSRVLKRKGQFESQQV